MKPSLSTSLIRQLKRLLSTGRVRVEVRPITYKNSHGKAVLGYVNTKGKKVVHVKSTLGERNQVYILIHELIHCLKMHWPEDAVEEMTDHVDLILSEKDKQFFKQYL